MFLQVKNLNLRLEQEIHKRSLSQSDLKMQNQQVSVLRSSEKQLKQELNHLLEMKQVLEKQNQELRRSNTHNNRIHTMLIEHKHMVYEFVVILLANCYRESRFSYLI